VRNGRCYLTKPPGPDIETSRISRLHGYRDFNGVKHGVKNGIPRRKNSTSAAKTVHRSTRLSDNELALTRKRIRRIFTLNVEILKL
jgi:hypothetical protein